VDGAFKDQEIEISTRQLNPIKLDREKNFAIERNVFDDKKSRAQPSRRGEEGASDVGSQRVGL
jgi:hypothetical protein